MQFWTSSIQTYLFCLHNFSNPYFWSTFTRSSCSLLIQAFHFRPDGRHANSGVVVVDADLAKVEDMQHLGWVFSISDVEREFQVYPCEAYPFIIKIPTRSISSTASKRDNPYWPDSQSSTGIRQLFPAWTSDFHNCKVKAIYFLCMRRGAEIQELSAQPTPLPPPSSMNRRSCWLKSCAKSSKSVRRWRNAARTELGRR